MRHRIAAIPGDGIGKEVVPEGMRVLDAAGRRFGFDIEWTTFDWSCERYTETGRMMPEDGLDRLRPFEAIFLGAVGFPGVPDHVSLWGLLIPIRRGFRQYVVSQAVREPRKSVRGQRGDNEDVPAPEMRVRIVGRSRSSKRVEGLGRDKPLCTGSEHRPNVVPGANEKANERAGLVGRNPAGHSEQDARHAPSLSRTGRGA